MYLYFREAIPQGKTGNRLLGIRVFPHDFRPECILSVSYTHLDVYKRQIHSKELSPDQKVTISTRAWKVPPGSSKMFLEPGSKVSVSYTHLDVYKRQLEEEQHQAAQRAGDEAQHEKAEGHGHGG